MSEATPDSVTVTTDDGFNVTSSGHNQTSEQLTEALKAPEGLEDTPGRDSLSKAASELGKRGAEARKAKKDAIQQPDLSTAGVADASDTSEGSGESGNPQTTGKPLGKPRDDPQARIDAITREKYEAKRKLEAAKAEAEAARKERDALKAQFAQYEPPKSKPVESTPGKPAQADFQTYDEWVEAVADWKADGKLQAYQAKLEQDAKVKEYASAIDSELSKAISARKEYEKTDPEFISKLSDEVKAIANVPSFARGLEEKVGPHHVVSDEIILAGGAGPRVMLHLSAHPEEVQRILALPTYQDIQVEMRILAKSLNGAASAGTASRAEVSKAKPPVRPVTGSSHTVDDPPDPDAASYDEHRKYWNQKEYARR